MSITQADIKLMASARLTDEDDGGGMMSAVEVEDGVVNNLFPDISRLDRAYGRVNLRKAYPAIQTANKDMFYGAHAILTDAPDDPRVSVLMFTTKSYSDERNAAQDRIESYLAPGTVSQFVLLGNQLQGQRTLSAYSKADTMPPEAGEAYVLRQENAGGDLIGPEQYVRVSDVKAETQSFEDSSGKFERVVYIISITAPLNHRFIGASEVVRTERHNSPTLIRNSQVADASKYYGIVKLSEPVTAGAMAIKASTIYGQLVPASTAESPVVDAQAGVDRPNIAKSGEPYSEAVPISAGTASFGRAVVQGSVKLGSYFDDGKGILQDTAGVERGLVDYATGQITGITGITGVQTYRATPATAVYDVAITADEVIGINNAGMTFIKTMRPIPTPGTLVIDYMAQGRWYRMVDGGDGGIVDAGGGAGSINYETGSVVITLGAIPDVGSRIIYTWTTPQHYDGGANVIPAVMKPGQLDFFIPGGGRIQPSTLSLSWLAGGVAKTATDNGTGGIVGDATGEVDYWEGKVSIAPTLVMDNETIINLMYKLPTGYEEAFSGYSIVDGNVVFSIANAPIKPGSFGGSFTCEQYYNKVYREDPTRHASGRYREETTLNIVRFYDNGSGILSVRFGPKTVTGTINYTTGEAVLPVEYHHERNSGNGYEKYVWDGKIVGSINARYTGSSPTLTDKTVTHDVTNNIINLAPTNTRQIMPGSIEFIWNDKIHIDREGLIYTDWNRTTGSAVPVGSVDYSTGKVTITSWAGGGENLLNVRTLLTKTGDWITSEITFRTSGAPLRAGSFYIRATRSDGVLLSATGNSAGIISGTELEGLINHETGIAEIKFGKFVLDSSLSWLEKQEPWYDVANKLPDGTIWKPTYVEPGSIKYNAIVQSVMPLDASILGINPVRLPIDGRVPIIRPGDIVVIFSKQETELPNSLTAGQTINLPDVELAACTLIDTNGEKVAEEHYTTDREAGTITMASPLDLAAYTQPLVAQWRVEDMALVNEAQINGQLTLVGSLTHDYDPANTWVSSALIFGDLASRAHHVFSQATWTNVWSDKRIGADTTAKFNDLLYPIQLNNKNSIRDRWAIIFTSATSFNVVGEQSGQIATGTTNQDCSPINPITGEPYFTIPWNGWGSGWANNNVLRFNTDAAHAPIWIARTTINGAPTKEDDAFKLQIRGDAD